MKWAEGAFPPLSGGTAQDVAVFVHGFAGTSALWAPVLEVLPAGWTACCLTVAGHASRGEEDRTDPSSADAAWGVPPPASSYEDEVSRLAGLVLEASDGDSARVHLVGYSQGARLSLSVALRLQAQARCLARLVLIGGAAGLQDPVEREARRVSDARLAQRLRRDPDAFFREWESLPLFASQQRHPEALARQQSWRQSLEPLRLAEALERLGLAEMPDHWSALSSLTCPVVLLVGEEDGKFRALAERMAALLRHPRLQVVPGCGHNVVLEQPQALARALWEESHG